MKPIKIAQETYRVWKFWYSMNECYPRFKDFWQEVKRYGDPLQGDTWTKAYVGIQTTSYEDAMCENPGILKYLFCQPDPGLPTKLNDELLEEYLKFPDALYHIKGALYDMLFDSSYRDDHEDAIAFIMRLQRFGVNPSALQLPAPMLSGSQAAA